MTVAAAGSRPANREAVDVEQPSSVLQEPQAMEILTEDLSSQESAAGIETSKQGSTRTSDGNTAGPISSELIKPNFAATVQCPPADHSMDIKSPQPNTRCKSLHQLVFKESGLPERALLRYKLKNGPVLKQGCKQGAAILCDCCAKTFSPSQFEEHAGNGRRRKPYHNIYTSDGLTLHHLALELQARSNLNEISGGDLSYTDEDPDFASSSSSKESSTSDRPIIVPLKRTLQERSAKIESCHLCGDSCATLGILSEDMIVFCNQCERPCHIKCYNSGPQKKKALNVLEEYMDFHFLCCPNCKLFRDSLDNVLTKHENETSPIQQKSNIGWQLLSGRNLTTRRQKLMTHQVTEIFLDAFPETASDIIQGMVNAQVVACFCNF